LARRLSLLIGSCIFFPNVQISKNPANMRSA